MQEYIKVAGLQVDKDLFDFVECELLPDLGLDKVKYWHDMADIFNTLTPLNKELLAVRNRFQNQINDWHQHHTNFNSDEYKTFLQNIGYLLPNPSDFKVETTNVDPEISTIAGAQLVVPVQNARFALNAANGRWGSLYDSMYGTDVIAKTGETAPNPKAYNAVRGEAVIAKSNDFLDSIMPLENAKYADVKHYLVTDNKLKMLDADNRELKLQNPSYYIGYNDKEIILNHNNLHIRLVLDENKALHDVVMESSISVIMDGEDSVVAVDGEDKVVVYRNWLGLMRGDLTETFVKNDKTFTRKLNDNVQYTDTTGTEKSLSGRALMLVRNVGLLMTNPAILDEQGNELPEGIMDAIITTTCAMHDLRKTNVETKNSKLGSVYIVKPKMHGSDEARFSNTLFTMVEEMLGLNKYTVKIGIMDEERRTTINLLRSIYETKNRIIFINTGFLDRTGDEIHTSMYAGAMITKDDMKKSKWLTAYETNNVYSGLQTGMNGRGQIGKGMWAKPDSMSDMLAEKISHPQSGATTAWVPSPTAGTLHAMHYHYVNVNSVQKEMLENIKNINIDDILSIPLLNNNMPSDGDIAMELDNNTQGLLGYMVRWIEFGVGCSKVPDINNVALMEDRATLRISSQYLTNWWLQGLCTKQQIVDSLRRMSVVVDKQNQNEANYKPIADNFDKHIVIKAACDLIFDGINQPSGYTEPILHQARRQYKKSN